VTALLLAACAPEPCRGARCGGPAPDPTTSTSPLPADADWSREVLATDLHLDLAAEAGTARITVAGSSTSSVVSFEVGDLALDAVEGPDGPLPFVVSDGPLATFAPGSRLDVGGLPLDDQPVALDVAWRFRPHHAFDGWMPRRGVSMLWPYACGNLFPCRSDPADGARFTLEVVGRPEDAVIVAPTAWETEIPAYVVAVAVGDYRAIELGETPAGTRVTAWSLPGNEARAQVGTAHLVDVVAWLEDTLGPYPYGDHLGTVETDWGGGDLGGMEHHPFWHVSSGDVDDEEVQAHEAAHGWFGDGVRIRCWEDFVLSEGTASWLAARSLEQVAGVDVWPEYHDWLRYSCRHYAPTAAWPQTCGDVDLPTDPLWSGIPYMQGACFYREVAATIGPEQVDGALRDVVAARVGQAASMADVVAALKARSPADAATIDALVADWLTATSCPERAVARCGG
jgi:hypothetical protein